MTRKDMVKKAAWALALWLAALFLLSAPAQAAHRARHHRHHLIQRQGAIQRQSQRSSLRVHLPLQLNYRKLGQYLPPNAAVGVTGTIAAGDSSYAVSRGDRISYYVVPGQRVAAGDVVILTVTYLYQKNLDKSWVVGTPAAPSLIFKSTDPKPNVPRLAYDIPTTLDWDKLVFVTDGTVRHLTDPPGRSISAEAVDFVTGLADEEARDAPLPSPPLRHQAVRRHPRLLSHYLPPNVPPPGPHH